MGTKQLIDGAVQHLQASSRIHTVYGEPIVQGSRTVIPVAKVDFGKRGSTGAKAKNGNGKADAKADAKAEETAPGGTARPVGVVEIDGERTKFVQFGAPKKLAITALVASGIGLGLGMMLTRKPKQT